MGCFGKNKQKVIINGRFKKPYYIFQSEAAVGKVLDIGQESGK